MPAIEPAGARAISPASAPDQGSRHTAPIAHAVNVTCRTGSRRSSGFWATTPIA